MSNKSKLLKNSQKCNLKWRDIQRDQLGVSANLYFIFGTAILGYNLDLLINKKNLLACESIVLLTISESFIILSLFFYALFTNNRLYDFRQTAKYYKQNKTTEEISELTDRIGKNTWLFYRIEMFLLFFGFIFALIGIGIYIYS